jgi:hypothetical protein
MKGGDRMKIEDLFDPLPEENAVANKDNRSSIGVCYKDEVSAELAMRWMNSQFNLGRDFRVKMGEKSKYGWELTLPEYAHKFKTTLEKMRDSASDFLSGWRAAEKFFSAKFNEEKKHGSRKKKAVQTE